MSRQASPRKLTYDDYVGFPDDGLQHEIIDGEHFVSPAPTVLHQQVCMRLAAALAIFVGEAKLGEVLCAPLDVVLTPHDVVQPDILFQSAARFAASLAESKQYLGTPPDLAIEVLSHSTRQKDLDRKRTLYERTGITEYWIVDPERTTVTIYRRTNSSSTSFGAASELTAERNDVLSTSLIPGWQLPLSSLHI